MNLAFDYTGQIKSRLQTHAPQTHYAIVQYHSFTGDYEIFPSTVDEFQQLLRRLCNLPDISDADLRSPRDVRRNLVPVLDLPRYDFRRGSIERTIDSHERKGEGFEDRPLYGDLTLVIARCIPFFLLESYTNNPRWQLFDSRAGKIHHFLPLLKKNSYPMLLS